MFVYVRVCTNGVKSSVSHVLYASLLYLTILMYWQGENHNTQPGLINVNVCTLGAKLGRNMKEMSACAHLAWCHFSKQTVITEVLWKFEWCFRRIFEICLFCLLFFFFFLPLPMRLCFQPGPFVGWHTYWTSFHKTWLDNRFQPR